MNAFFLSLAPGFSQVFARGINISAVSTAFPSFSKLLKQLIPRLCSDTGLKPCANERRSHSVLVCDLSEDGTSSRRLLRFLDNL
jgi:hypothetical protein